MNFSQNYPLFLLAIKFQEWGSFILIDLDAPMYCRWGIVIPLVQFPTAPTAFQFARPWFLSRFQSMGCLAAPAHHTPAQSVDQFAVWHIDRDDQIQGPGPPAQSVVQGVSLDRIPGEPVQDEAVIRGDRHHFLQNHVYGHLVWNECALVHIFGRF